MTKEKMSKVNNWVKHSIYKEARKTAIELDLTWREVIEEALMLFIDAHRKEDEKED